MTGYPEWNRPAFMEAEAKLIAAGFEVINPARNKLEDDSDWHGYMRLSVKQVAEADGVATLRGWQSSRGATGEVSIADLLDLPVMDVDTWVLIAESAPAAA